MQYCRKAQNNRLDFSFKAKKKLSFKDIDTASNSSYDTASDEKTLKNQSTVSSTTSSRIASPLSLSSCEDESREELDEEEMCSEIECQGVCWRGKECGYSHGVTEMWEGRRTRVGGIMQERLQNFPELLLITPVRRLGSFLQ